MNLVHRNASENSHDGEAGRQKATCCGVLRCAFQLASKVADPAKIKEAA